MRNAESQPKHTADTRRWTSRRRQPDGTTPSIAIFEHALRQRRSAGAGASGRTASAEMTTPFSLPPVLADRPVTDIERGDARQYSPCHLETLRTWRLGSSKPANSICLHKMTHTRTPRRNTGSENDRFMGFKKLESQRFGDFAERADDGNRTRVISLED